MNDKQFFYLLGGIVALGAIIAALVYFSKKGQAAQPYIPIPDQAPGAGTQAGTAASGGQDSKFANRSLSSYSDQATGTPTGKPKIGNNDAVTPTVVYQGTKYKNYWEYLKAKYPAKAIKHFQPQFEAMASPE